MQEYLFSEGDSDQQEDDIQRNCASDLTARFKSSSFQNYGSSSITGQYLQQE